MKRLLVMALLVAVACGSGAPEAPPDPVDGLIVSIEDSTLRLRADGGGTFSFVIADPSVAVEHLRVHMRDDLPVRIAWERRDGKLAATSIADAPS